MKLSYSSFRSWGENERESFPYAHSSYVLINTKTNEIKSVVVTAISDAKQLLEAMDNNYIDILGFWVGQYRSDVFKIEKDEDTKNHMLNGFTCRWKTFVNYL